MKKIGIFLGVLVLGCLIWYVFLKPYDYLVTFQAKTIPGAIQQTVKLWTKTLDTAQIIDTKGITELSQQLKFKDSVHVYDWEITPINDSLSKITVYAKDVQHSLKNRIAIPFSDTDFEKRTRSTLMDFLETLNEHIGRFKVTLVGQEEFKKTFCACTSLYTTQLGKAQGMMKDFPLLDNIFIDNGVKLNGPPILEVTDWNRETDSLKYNFCYPVIKSDQLPAHPDLFYKDIASKEAVKAIYNGNYITSDRAWYALLDYAEKNDLEVTGLPVEVFHNNPNMGGDELKWKTEIYMPLKTTDE